MNERILERQAGYSLVEVLIAMALLGTVVMSIITLFYLGRRNVYAGKQQTKITAIGTRMMEDLTNMTADDVMSNFNIPTTMVATCATINGVAYTNCIARKTSTFVSADDPGGFMTRWKTLLGSVNVGEKAFAAPEITLIVTPVNSTLTTGRYIRVRGILQWREGSRTRYSIYDASKMARPNENLTQ
jgi:prepilin-type N-terminal cleavage/methylation domain-containing protein